MEGRPSAFHWMTFEPPLVLWQHPILELSRELGGLRGWACLHELYEALVGLV